MSGDRAAGRHKSHFPYVHGDDAANLTFEEIAKVLGSNKKAVFFVYRKAIAKLRARPHAMEKLRELARERHRIRYTGGAQ